MGEDHEHRDDAQQLDAGIPLPPPICDSGMCRCAVFGVYAVVVLRVLFLFVHKLKMQDFLQRLTNALLNAAFVF